MTISQDELLYLQSQLEGLESIFLELMPFGVELKRQQVQDYYEKRFDYAVKPTANVAETEVRRQFNTKANQVRNLVDSAESLGEAGNKLNLIRAAASLPEERNKPLKPAVTEFCQNLLFRSTADLKCLHTILSQGDLTAVEVRVLLGAAMFLVVEEVETDELPCPVKDLLSQIIQQAASIIGSNDPFLVEAQCALDAMKDEGA